MQISHDKQTTSNKKQRHNYAQVTDAGALRVTTTSAGGGERDAFGRFRVSQISTQLDLKQIHDNLPLFFDEEKSGTGNAVHTVSTASTLMTTSADADFVIRQTFQRSNYQSGKGHQIFMTLSDFHDETNVLKRVGYYSSNTTTPFNSDIDGLMLENNAGTITFKTYRTGTITNSAEQSTWDDPLDGTGESGVTIDWEKTNIIMFQFEWLGVGSCEMFVVVDGVLYSVHKFKNANNKSDVYMSSPNHPLRYEIRQSGAGSGQLKHICCTVGSEGSVNEIGTIQSANLGSSHVNANTVANTYALLGIRLQTAKVGTAIDILSFSAVALTSDSFLWKVILNPTVAGTFNYSSLTNSSVQIAYGDTSGDPSTNTVTGGTVLASGYSTSQGANLGAVSKEIVNALRLGMAIDGTLDTIVFCVQPLSINLDIVGAIEFRERT